MEKTISSLTTFNLVIWMKKMLLAITIVSMVMLRMASAEAAAASSAENSTVASSAENSSDISITYGFDGKDDDGSPGTVHDVNLNGHMELWSYYFQSNYGAWLGGHAWCLVYKKYYLEGGKDTTFSISGYIYGKLESPTLEDVALIQIRMQVYKDTYWRGHPWKEWIVYSRSTSGIIDQPISAYREVSGEEISTGYYYVAFVANIVASGRSTNLEVLADFHEGAYCVEAYSAVAQQQEEPKPDLWWSDVYWNPNPPKKG